MIDRHRAGLLPDKPHTVQRAPDGKLLHEEMLTRGGFGGAFSYFYHRFPVGAHRQRGRLARVARAGAGSVGAPTSSKAPLPLGPGRAAGGMLVDRRLPMLFNDDVTVLLGHAADGPTTSYFANGDGDELWFVRDGSARLESPCGWLDVKAGDYVWVPKAIVHSWHVPGGRVRACCASKCAAAFRSRRRSATRSGSCGWTPRTPIATSCDPSGRSRRIDAPLEGPRELIVKKRGIFTRYALDSPAMDVVGWEGFVYPFAFAIEKFQPKTGLVHLPPTIHSTFEAPGLLVCSFVPRMLDTHPQAIPCPYPHSSVDCDEVILYLRGNFTSRRGVGPGAISLHPSGVAHGPHPGAYEASIGATRTDELAVMCDTCKPLVPTAQAANLEDRGYHESWSLAPEPA